MLHILNGDGTAGPFAQANIPADEVIVWREILFEGPLRLTPPEQFWPTRQRYLTQTYGEGPATYAEMVTAEVNRLENYTHHNEVVLWFEHDLLCQVNLLYLLHWFAPRDLGSTALSLVGIGSHPEKPNFKGLGELSPAQLVALFPQRQLLTAADLALGDRGWHAYAAPTPEGLVQFLREDFTRLPLLPPALAAHLTRFPSVQNGLNAIEQLLLTIIAESSPATLGLCERFWEETSLFGLGDAQIMNYLREMEQAGLVHVADHITLTALGRRVWQAEADYRLLKPRDYWLGGVHVLPGLPAWRWDRSQQQLVKE